MRVAVYCRVSTDKEDQANSFESQKRYFSEVISRRPDLVLYEIYADEGVSGTTTAKRREFNRMIADARSGRFDRIITKEVSRFARNTVDTLNYTRELRALGIGVEFVTDGIDTLEPDAELRLSIMSSIAQEESRKTSSRVKWGQARRMEQGVVFGRSLLGYDVKDGQMTVNEAGARIVRRIFRWYVTERMGAGDIADRLTNEGIPTARGNREWSGSVIVKILKNEKYCGDLLQKKTVTPDYLTHRKVNNRGQEEMIYLRDHHEPIVSRALWEAAQEELRRRRRRKPKVEVTEVMGRVENISGGGDTSEGGNPAADGNVSTDRNGAKDRNAAGAGNRYPLSGRIRCGCCGSSFVARWRTTRKGERYLVWRCAKAVREGRQADSGRGCPIGYQLRNDVVTELIAQLGGSVRGDKIGETDRRRQQKRVLQRKRIRLMDSYLAGEISVSELELMRAEYERQERAIERKGERSAAGEPCSEYEAISYPEEQIIVWPDRRLEVSFGQKSSVSVKLPNYREYAAEQGKFVRVGHEDAVFGVSQ